MNLILFESAELSAPLSLRDPRAAHLLGVLRRGVGGTFDCGLVNGPRGKATVVALDAVAVTLTFAWDTTPPPAPAPITLLLGLPRPQTARDILRDATSLGVAALHFVATDKGDPNYAHSSLWSSGEWRRHLVIGAEQAFDTHLPVVSHSRPLSEVLTALPAPTTSLVLDFGPERGWSAAERDAFRARHFRFAHLGPRVLRTETAVIAAVALVRAGLGLL